MAITWTKTAKAKLLPFPGEAWKVDVKLAKAEQAIAAVACAVPAKPVVKAEVERGIALRLDQRYDAKGNHPRDTLPRDAVDVWCARAGVAFATEVLIGIVKSKPARSQSATNKHYALRRDAQPWGRLREHLAAATPEAREQAHAIAAKAREPSWGELSPALSYAFCDPAWVAADLDGALKAGYGQLSVIAALADAKQAAKVLETLIGAVQKFQLIEESVPFIPNLMARLGDNGTLLRRAAAIAWNKASAKPWLDYVACYGEATAPKAKPEAKAKPAKAAAPKQPKKR